MLFLKHLMQKLMIRNILECLLIQFILMDFIQIYSHFSIKEISQIGIKENYSKQKQETGSLIIRKVRILKSICILGL